MSKQIEKLTEEVRALREEVRMAIAPNFCFRNDRDAGQYVGINSPWRFNLWAIKHGLKPKKKAQHARTVYLKKDLEAAVLKDKAAQFKEQD